MWNLLKRKEKYQMAARPSQFSDSNARMSTIMSATVMRDHHLELAFLGICMWGGESRLKWQSQWGTQLRRTITLFEMSWSLWDLKRKRGTLIMHKSPLLFHPLLLVVVLVDLVFNGHYLGFSLSEIEEIEHIFAALMNAMPPPHLGWTTTIIHKDKLEKCV